jgi:uncharacterized protein YjiK
MYIFFYWLLFIFILFPSINQQDKKSGNALKKIEYNISSPDKVYSLPATLYEISGITEIDASTVACVQDENGIVFIYDLNKNEITGNIIFGSKGDYEDIARVDNTLYVLRSDESLTEIKNFKDKNFTREASPVSIPGKDCEGLCYDRKNNRLLIVPKEISDDNPDNKGKRFIYAFDLISKTLIRGPVFRFDIKAIERFATENNIKVPMSGKKGEKEKPDLKIRISALGIHPITNRLFAISGMEHMLFVFDMNGKIEYLGKLDHKLFTQPEGITFMKNGDMLISNEGRNELATILRFNFKK